MREQEEGKKQAIATESNKLHDVTYCDVGKDAISLLIR